MRSTLNELPVFIACLWGGTAAGLLISLLRMPRLLYSRSRRGRREGVFALILLGIIDIIAAAAAALALCAVLVYANGGEPRLYALTAFAIGAFIPIQASKALINKKKTERR